MKGQADHSVQSEASGAERSENLANDRETSGGAAGRINDLDNRRKGPGREGGLNDENRGLTR